MADRPVDDPLDELRGRIQATREAAERLAQEAGRAQREAREGRVPPAGWQTPCDREKRSEDLRSLTAALESLRALVPPELQEQITEIIRQMLLLIRAIIDWWVDRLEQSQKPAGGKGSSAQVEDIPVL